MSNIKKVRQSDRAFGFTITGLILFVSCIFWFAIDAFSMIPLVIAVIFFCFALFSPNLLFPLNRLWNALLSPVGQFNNSLILGLFFFLILTPIGLMFRLFGRHSLAHGFKPELPTYYSPVSRQTDTETLVDLF
jgi:hypothetical protein